MLGFDALAKLPLGAAPSAGVNASLSVAQADNTSNSEAVVAVAGAANLTQADQSVSATGVVAVVAASTLTQADQSISSSGAALVSASATLAQADQSISGNGSVAVDAEASFSQADQTVAAEALLSSGTVCSADLSQDGNTLSASSVALITGTVALTQAEQSASISGVVALKASASLSETGNTLSSDAFGRLNASLSETQDGNTTTAETGVLVEAQSALSQVGDTVSASGLVPVFASLSSTQVSDSITTSAAARAAASVDITQAENTLLSIAEQTSFATAGGVQDSQSVTAIAKIAIKAALNATQEGDRLELPPPFVVAPSYSTWVKTKNRNKPKAPQLPPPVNAGEVVIDEAVLRQMEEERLAALVLQKKAEASARIDEMRASAFVPERGTRTLKLDPQRFDVVETSPEIRTRVIKLFRPPEPEPLKEPVRGSITLRALGPRNLPKPRITYADRIAIRRSSDRMMQTGT